MQNITATILGQRYSKLTADIKMRRTRLVEMKDEVSRAETALAEQVAEHEALETDLRAAGKTEYL